jgi:hypothetical protein
MSSPKPRARTPEEARNELDPSESSPLPIAQPPYDYRDFDCSSLRRMGLSVVFTSSPIKGTPSALFDNRDDNEDDDIPPDISFQDRLRGRSSYILTPDDYTSTSTNNKQADYDADVADEMLDRDSSTPNIASVTSLSADLKVSKAVRDEIVCLIKGLLAYITVLINLSLDANYSEIRRYIDTMVSILEGLRHLLS